VLASSFDHCRSTHLPLSYVSTRGESPQLDPATRFVPVDAFLANGIRLIKFPQVQFGDFYPELFIVSSPLCYRVDHLLWEGTWARGLWFRIAPPIALLSLLSQLLEIEATLPPHERILN